MRKKPGPTAIGPGPRIFSDPAEDAAARRATRRLPLGEPPLVITTHSITSYTIGPSRPCGSPASSKTGPGLAVPRSHGPRRSEVSRDRQPQYRGASGQFNPRPREIRFSAGRAFGPPRAAPRHRRRAGQPRVAALASADHRPVIPEDLFAAGVRTSPRPVGPRGGRAGCSGGCGACRPGPMPWRVGRRRGSRTIWSRLRSSQGRLAPRASSLTSEQLDHGPATGRRTPMRSRSRVTAVSSTRSWSSPAMTPARRTRRARGSGRRPSGARCRGRRSPCGPGRGAPRPRAGGPARTPGSA